MPNNIIIAKNFLEGFLAKGKKTVVDSVWDFLSSIKLAVVLFSLISLTSIIGTVLEQQAAPEKNIKIIGKLFGQSLALPIYSAFESLGFLDMYSSWWFVSILLLFGVNILVCSLDRFPAVWKVVKEPIKPLAEEHFGAVPIKREFTLKGGREKAVEALMGKSGLKFREREGQMLWERGRFSRLGVFVSHISIITILAGAIVGIFLGFKGMLNIPEGATYPFAFMRVKLTGEEVRERGLILEAIQRAEGSLPRAASILGAPERQLEARMKKLGIAPLGFSLRCDDFEVSFYGASEMPKDYSSTLTVIDGGREVLRKVIEVNDPLKYKGITFYQSSYGLLDEANDVEFKIKGTSAAGTSEAIRVHSGEKFLIPGTAMAVSVISWSPSISFDTGGKAFTSSRFMNNPAVQVEITEGGKTYTKWLLRRYPETWRLEGGHIVELQDIWGAQYTGLQVRRDPGVWVVYLGCIVLSIGLFVAFFSSHRRIWVRLVPEKGGTKVVMAATANKNPESFERKVDKIISLVRAGGK